jgi:chromosome segregation ATPase
MTEKKSKDDFNVGVQPSQTIDILASAVVETDDKPVETPVEVIEELTANAELQQPSTSNGSAQVELEAKIAQLKAALEQAHHREEMTVGELRSQLEKAHKREYDLQESIYQLKSELYEQKSLVQKLEQDLNQASSTLKSEFETAKKTALELAQANGKLIEEIKELKQQKLENPAEKPAEKPISQAMVRKKYVPIMEKLPTEQPRQSSSSSSPMWLLD